VLSASAKVSGEAARRFNRVTELFGVTEEAKSKTFATPSDTQAKAS